jgi:hypothetical protein
MEFDRLLLRKEKLSPYLLLESATACTLRKIKAEFNEKLLVIQMPISIWLNCSSHLSLHLTDPGILLSTML